MNDEEYISIDYHTISADEKMELVKLCGSTLINAFNTDDYMAILSVFWNVIDRLEGQYD